MSKSAVMVFSKILQKMGGSGESINFLKCPAILILSIDFANNGACVH